MEERVRGVGLLSTVAAAEHEKFGPPRNAPTGKKQANKCTRGKVNCGLLHDNMSLMWGEMKECLS